MRQMIVAEGDIEGEETRLDRSWFSRCARGAFAVLFALVWTRRDRNWLSRCALLFCLLLALANAMFKLNNPQHLLFGTDGPWILVGLVVLVVFWLWRKL